MLSIVGFFKGLFKGQSMYMYTNPIDPIDAIRPSDSMILYSIPQIETILYLSRFIQGQVKETRNNIRLSISCF